MASRTTSPARTAIKPRLRAPGRPTADSADLRLRLLDSALACFVRKGIAATSLRDIAGEAHVTPALLHYYFGEKTQ
ncbi:MAG: TetR family transcriptional regulator, partial [Luteimonas sp.]